MDVGGREGFRCDLRSAGVRWLAADVLRGAEGSGVACRAT